MSAAHARFAMTHLDQLGALCIGALEQMGIGVIGCDDSLAVLEATPTALRLLSLIAPAGEGRLPDAVRAAASAALARSDDGRRTLPRRVESADRRCAIYVNTRRVDLPPTRVAIHLQLQRMTDVELFETLRERFELSARDRRLIGLLRQGQKNAEIAAALELTVGTVKSYVHDLFEKLEVHSRGELMAVFDRLAAHR